MITPILWLAAMATSAPDVAVVCPSVFRAELAPWVEHRTRQGHQLVFVDASGTATEISKRLTAIAKPGSLRHVVLVGDVPARSALANNVPTHYQRAKVNILWGSEPEIATDLPYADFDADGLPDVSVGRLPVDTPAQLRVLVQKILAYETNADFSDWRRRVNFIAGLGGFGAIADSALEAAAKKLITDGVPASFCTSMTYGSWRSPYCPDPREFRQATLNTLNQGCLFWVYIGHGHRRNVDWVHVPGGNFPILSDGDVPHLRCRSGSPIACFLACYAGAFDHAEDCLAEEMLLSPGGPVAVYAGSRVTMPYAMSVMGMAMLEACFGEEPAQTLGDAVRLTKRKMMTTKDLSANRRALDVLAALVSPSPVDLAAERGEHLYLFNLLGDPLLRLPQSHQVRLDLPKMVKAGEAITVAGVSDIGGSATLELIVRRDRLTFKAPARPRFEPTSYFLSRFNEIYQRANDPRLFATQLAVKQGDKFECSIKPPADATGPCHVRVFVEGKDACAVGHCDVQFEE